MNRLISRRHAVLRSFVRLFAVAAVAGLVLVPVVGVHGAQARRAALVPLPLQLPKPMFEGTPQNLSVPNLQKPLGKPREPFLAPAGVTNVAKGKARSRAATASP